MDFKRAGFTAIIVLIIFLLPFNILLNLTSYQNHQIQKYNNDEVHLEINKNTTSYIKGFSKNLNAPYTEKEKLHLSDVRKLIIFQEVLFIISLLILSYGIIKKQIIKKDIKLAATSTITISFLLTLSSLVFNKTFRIFHKIFFPQGNFKFSYDSLIIKTYNQEFFLGFFITTIIISAIISILMILICLLHKPKINHKQI